MRLTPGAIWLRANQKYGHGLRVAWYRDVVRPRILSTPPITGTTDKRCEIHVLTSKEDWLNLIWTLKSFYIASGRRYALCIHEDGSLDRRGACRFGISFSGRSDHPACGGGCETCRGAARFSAQPCIPQHQLARAESFRLCCLSGVGPYGECSTAICCFLPSRKSTCSGSRTQPIGATHSMPTLVTLIPWIRKQFASADRTPDSRPA